MGTTPTSAAHKEAEQMPEASQHLLVHSYWARPESIHPDPSEA